MFDFLIIVQYKLNVPATHHSQLNAPFDTRQLAWLSLARGGREGVPTCMAKSRILQIQGSDHRVLIFILRARSAGDINANSRAGTRETARRTVVNRQLRVSCRVHDMITVCHRLVTWRNVSPPSCSLSCPAGCRE